MLLLRKTQQSTRGTSRQLYQTCPSTPRWTNTEETKPYATKHTFVSQHKDKITQDKHRKLQPRLAPILKAVEPTWAQEQKNDDKLDKSQ